jgi:hypothetical protein
MMADNDELAQWAARELARQLQIEPSPGFEARLRAQIATGSDAGLRVWGWATVATLVALGVLVVLFREAPPVAKQPVSSAQTTEPARFTLGGGGAVVSLPSGLPRLGPRHRRARGGAPNGAPEVLIRPEAKRILLRVVELAESGGLADVPAEPVTGPGLSNETVLPIRVEDLQVPAIQVPAGSQLTQSFEE